MGVPPSLPELGFVQHARQCDVCALRRAAGSPETSAATGSRPAGLLGGFQLVVIVFALALNLGAEAVKALMRSFCPGQNHVAHGAAQAAVAVVKRVQVTSHRWASPALMRASPSGAASNQSKRPGFARAGWRQVGLQSALSPFPQGPDTTCMGPLASVRHAATVMRVRPL